MFLLRQYSVLSLIPRQKYCNKLLLALPAISISWLSYHLSLKQNNICLFYGNIRICELIISWSCLVSTKHLGLPLHRLGIDTVRRRGQITYLAELHTLSLAGRVTLLPRSNTFPRPSHCPNPPPAPRLARLGPHQPNPIHGIESSGFLLIWKYNVLRGVSFSWCLMAVSHVTRKPRGRCLGGMRRVPIYLQVKMNKEMT